MEPFGAHEHMLGLDLGDAMPIAVAWEIAHGRFLLGDFLQIGCAPCVFALKPQQGLALNKETA